MDSRNAVRSPSSEEDDSYSDEDDSPRSPSGDSPPDSLANRLVKRMNQTATPSRRTPAHQPQPTPSRPAQPQKTPSRPAQPQLQSKTTTPSRPAQPQKTPTQRTPVASQRTPAQTTPLQQQRVVATPSRARVSEDNVGELVRQRACKEDFDNLWGGELANYVVARAQRMVPRNGDDDKELPLAEQLKELAANLYDNPALVMQEIDAFRKRFEDRATKRCISTFHLDELFATWWQSTILLISTHNMEGTEGMVDLDVSRPSFSAFLVQLWRNVSSHFAGDESSLVANHYDTRFRVKKVLRSLARETLQEVVNRDMENVLSKIHEARKTALSRTASASTTPATRTRTPVAEQQRAFASPAPLDADQFRASPAVIKQLYGVNSEKLASTYDSKLFD